MNLLSKNWLVHKIADRALDEVIQKYARGKLIDIGCGTKPYKDLLSLYVKWHVGLDHIDTLHEKSAINIFGTAYNIPIEAESFDTVICTAVLEHLEEPELALRESWRVLKWGGVAIYSVPFIWHVHEQPRDFYRFSKYGLRYLFEKNDFEILELKALSGFWVTFGQLFVYYIYRFRLGGKINPLWWLIPPIGLAIQRIAYILDHLDKAEQWTWMYIVVSRKK